MEQNDCVPVLIKKHRTIVLDILYYWRTHRFIGEHSDDKLLRSG